jgi:peptidoglycan/LPS O-acetylase OafA/YrhL
MLISITDPVQSTYIFIAIFAIAILVSFRKKKEDGFFPISITNELKGVGILTVLFGHIGYFLVNDNRFLFPLSAISGVGVDLFLFLSGYGLMVSAIRKARSRKEFYKDRLIKLFVPFWIALAFFFLLDFFVLNKGYSAVTVISSFLGYFPIANLYSDINSPLWYFTLILFYYLLFPLVFMKKRPWLSAIIIFALTYLILAINFGFMGGVRYFYSVHYWAFPIGATIAGIVCQTQGLQVRVSQTIGNLNKGVVSKICKNFAHYALMAALTFVIAYTSYYSGVGKSFNIEQLISIVTTLAFTALFLLKKMEIRLFSLLGLYSYEIYLLHWPILYRYDVLFRFLPAWLAMFLYLALFVGMAWLLQKVSEKIVNIFLKKKSILN